jgi:hypothetical protein
MRKSKRSKGRNCRRIAVVILDEKMLASKSLKELGDILIVLGPEYI